jgi:hypothetical protein
LAYQQLVRWIALVGKVLGIPHHLHDIDWVRRRTSAPDRAGSELIALMLNTVTAAVSAAVAKMTVIWRILLSSQKLSINPATTTALWHRAHALW